MTKDIIEKMKEMAKNNQFEDSPSVLDWLSNLSPEDKKMVSLVIDFTYDRGYEDGQDH